MGKIKFPLSFKIFVMVMGVVMAALAIVSFQNNTLVYSILTRNFQSSSLTTSEKFGSEIEKFVIRLDNELFRLIQSSLLADKKDGREQAARFLASSPYAVSVAILREKDQNIDIVQNSTILAPPPDSLSDFSWLKNQIAAKPERINHFYSLKGNDDKTFIAFARRFKVDKTATIFWGVVILEPGAFLDLSTGAGKTQVALAKSDLTLLASNLEHESQWQDVRNGSSLGKTVSLGIQSAYLGAITDRSNIQWLGSFYQIAEYDLLIFIQQRADAVYGKIYSLLAKIGLWASLILLFTILVSYITARSITFKLTKVIDATHRIARGDFDLKILVKSRDEVGDLVDSVNVMAQKISALMQMEKEKVRYEKELSTAQTVQDTFFTAEDYKTAGIQISGYHKPSTECCGDWWSHVKLGDGIEQIYIGDATGHGAPAALVTAMTYTAVHTLTAGKENTDGHIPTPGEVLTILNRILHDTLKGSMFMTFFIMQIDTKKRQITYSNAGHCFPYLIPKNPSSDDRLDRSSRLRGIKPLMPIDKERSVLGAQSEINFFDHTLPLKDGDRFFLYSDGAFEFLMEDGKQYGVHRLQKFVMEYRGLPLIEFRDEVARSLEALREKGQADDDMTFVAVEYGTTAVV